MSGVLTFAACLTAVLSATALYAGSGHCRWAALRRLGRSGTFPGLVLAALALALWCVGYGIGAGLCLALLSWMTAAMALPYLAVWTGRSTERRE